MSENNPIVVIETSKGEVTVELFADKAPVSTENFLSYVRSGFFENTVFHRVIPNFMVQGGGYDWKLNEKPTQAPIKNEAANGCKNERGTLAMARTSDVDSATAQFFINLVDNDFLDHAAPNAMQFGYAVFGKVIEGMETVDAMAKVPTRAQGMHEAVPTERILIKTAVEM